MKRTIRTPYFEIGTKNYIWGDKVLEYAQAADRAAEKYDIDVLFITTPVELRRVVENTRHLIVLAPYMDTLQPGRGMADILPEALKDAKVDEKQLDRVEAIILSMTIKERYHPEILNSSRKRRIAAGSGTTVEDVNRLLKQYDQTKQLMKRFMGGGKKRGKMRIPF